MKKLTLALTVLAAAWTSFTARADDGYWTESGTNYQCGYTNLSGLYTNLWNTFSNFWSGCTNLSDGSYHEGCAQVITLDATTNAPAGAGGSASLRGEGDDDQQAAMVKVTLSGLEVGTYNVSLTDTTGTNSYALGNVDVTTNSAGGDGDETDEDLPTNSVATGRASFPLPAGLDPTNVASLFVFDTNQVVLLTGSFTGQTNTTAVYYCETVRVASDESVDGQGTLSLAWHQGKTTGTITLTASGLPPKQSLLITADGRHSTTAKTSRQGTLSVKAMPHANLVNLQTLEAKDKHGHTVFTLRF